MLPEELVRKRPTELRKKWKQKRSSHMLQQRANDLFRTEEPSCADGLPALGRQEHFEAIGVPLCRGEHRTRRRAAHRSREGDEAEGENAQKLHSQWLRVVEVELVSDFSPLSSRIRTERIQYALCWAAYSPCHQR